MDKPYVCLLNACAATANLDQVYAIIRDMTAAGAGLNDFCYAGLITAYMNKRPVPDDAAMKIIEFVEQSRGWSSVESANDSAENTMMGVSKEELYNLPTADYVNRRGGFLNRQFAVYHVAFHACANLGNVQAMETLSKMLVEEEKKWPDAYILVQTMRCYLRSGDIDNGVRILDDFKNSGKPPIEIYTTLVEGAMIGHTPRGMQLAFDTLVEMTSRKYFLNPSQGSNLLFKAAHEKDGGYTTANYIWDLMQERQITPSFKAVEAYYEGLNLRSVPEDDPRLRSVCQALDNIKRRNVGGAVGYNR